MLQRNIRQNWLISKTTNLSQHRLIDIMSWPEADKVNLSNTPYLQRVPHLTIVFSFKKTVFQSQQPTAAEDKITLVDQADIFVYMEVSSLSAC